MSQYHQESHNTQWLTKYRLVSMKQNSKANHESEILEIENIEILTEYRAVNDCSSSLVQFSFIHSIYYSISSTLS